MAVTLDKKCSSVVSSSLQKNWRSRKRECAYISISMCVHNNNLMCEGCEGHIPEKKSLKALLVAPRGPTASYISMRESYRPTNVFIPRGPTPTVKSEQLQPLSNVFECTRDSTFKHKIKSVKSVFSCSNVGCKC